MAQVKAGEAPVKVTNLADFKAVLSGNVLVAVDFTATWCGPCRMIGPEFDKMALEFKNIVCIKVDVDENSEAAEQAGISAMPTFKFYKNGEQVDELVGASAPKLKELFLKYN